MNQPNPENRNPADYLAERKGFALACGLGQGRLWPATGRSFTTDPFESRHRKSGTDAPVGVCFVWRRGRDSNPCALSRKLISSQPRYDHFDTSPYMFTLKNEGNNHYSIF